MTTEINQKQITGCFDTKIRTAVIQIFKKKSFSITIIHETASLLSKVLTLLFYLSLFSVDFQNRKKLINKKTHTHKSYLGKSISRSDICTGKPSSKYTTQSKKSKLSDSNNMPNLSFEKLTWHASNYKPH